MSLRDDIMAAVCARFETITPQNGYTMNLQGKVHQWRSAPFTEPELPALIVRDLRNDAETEGIIGYSVWLLSIEVLVCAVPPSINGVAMRAMIAEVEAEIDAGGQANWGFADGVDMTSQASDEMLLDQEETSVVGARIMFTIRYFI